MQKCNAILFKNGQLARRYSHVTDVSGKYLEVNDGYLHVLDIPYLAQDLYVTDNGTLNLACNLGNRSILHLISS